MLDLIKAVALATEAHEGQYRKAIKVKIIEKKKSR